MEIIHIVLGKVNPNRMNGVNKVVFDLAKNQHNSGRNVSVWGISATGKDSELNLPFPVRIFQAYKNLFRLDADLIQALQEQKENCLVHLHGSWIPTFYSLSRVLQQLHIPYVTMQHGGYNQIAVQKGKWKKWIYFPLFEKKVIRDAALVHCIGQSEVLGLQQFGWREKAYLQAYGYAPQALTTENTKNADFTFCFMGRLDLHTKGLDLLLNSFEKLIPIYPTAKLWFIGEGSDRPTLEKWVTDRKLDENVQFWGALYGADKNEKMAQSHVFLHPSRNEGLPAAIFEAANLKLPIIASKATNLGAAIAKYEAGWVVENEDENALFSAMQEAINPILCSEKGDQAFEMVRTEFNWETTLTQFDKMYAHACQK